MISVTVKGSFRNTERYLRRLQDRKLFDVLEKYGSIGVNALSNATPVDTGLTSQSWSYTIVRRKGYYSIRWHNSNVRNGIPIAVLIQYGHATRTGAYIQGIDYVNPAIRPIFEQIAEDARKEVTKLS